MTENIDWKAIEKSVLTKRRIKASIRAEELRDKLDPEGAIRQLLSLVHEADRTPVDQIPRLKFKADVLTTILRKCMPDLRALEIKENDSKFSKLIIDLSATDDQSGDGEG